MVTTLGLGVALVFGASALACFAGIARARLLRTPAARTGLRWLLGTVGVWALLEAGQVLATTETVSIGFYTAGLVVGFATPFAWLYFVSAYTGRRLHRDPILLVGAAGLYLSVVSVKLTNPIHGGYYAAELVAEPFPQLVIDHEPLYWISFTAAYAITGVGLYLLIASFRQSPGSAGGLVGLAVATTLPVVPRAASFFVPRTVPELGYEPIGVAVFAVGVLYVVDEEFVALATPGRREFFDDSAQGAIMVDPDGRIWTWNDRAADLISGLGDEVRTLAEISPTLSLEVSRQTIDFSHETGDRRYVVTTRDIAEAPGSMLLFRDVTRASERRRELARHNRQLGEMAGAIRHELRNALTVLRFALERARSSSEASSETREAIAAAARATDRLEGATEQLHDLVRYAQSVEEFDAIDLRTCASRALLADSPIALRIRGDATIEADPARLEALFANAIEFAAYNGADELSVELLPDGFALADDGRHASAEYGDRLFAYEDAAPTAEAGMTLPNVRTIAEAHGWTIAPDTEYEAGVRYVVTGATVAQRSADPVP